MTDPGEWPELDDRTAGPPTNPAAERRDEDWFSKVFHANPVPASLTTFPGGAFIDVNETFLRTFEYDRDEVVGKTAADIGLFDNPDDAPRLRQILQEEGSVRGVEVNVRTRTGTALQLLMFLDTIELGGQTRALVTGYNITMRRKAEDELRRSEAYLAEGERISHTGSWAWNIKSDTQYWSQEMFRICGFDPAEGPPTLTEALTRIHPEDARRVESSLSDAIAVSGDVEGDYRLILPDGSMKYIHYLAHPVVPKSGPIIEYFGTVVDMTVQKRDEEQLNSSLNHVRALAGRLMRVQDDERRRIARELHETTAQDLAALKLNLSALERDALTLDPRLMSIVSESAALADQTMRDVRTLSYLLHPPFLDDVGLTSALRWFTTGFAQRSGLALELVVADDFERLSRDIETTLFRIVQESLNNIHRHSQSPRAAIRLRRNDQSVTLEVEDWGRGLPSPGGNSDRLDRQSLGVGIPGMHERVEQIGGVLAIESSSSGTLVRVRIPLTRADT
ncbi:MAG: PAS domain-containing protein [Gemmatimonadales bacterium]